MSRNGAGVANLGSYRSKSTQACVGGGGLVRVGSTETAGVALLGSRVGAAGKTRAELLDMGCGVLCVMGLRPRDLSTSVAQLNHEGVGDIVWAIT